ncbi:LCP family protein|uniref:Transcriptional attenuator, LytR family n=1 Tax=Dendrosporobacter quercicolus TaxID=146817 RepID=A0A1G9TMT7_9FIRM|nr:LCP family protein [Dendrosporobacter quercicolus]NSL48925.1 LCP family protein [Dendrosporobacter quercicolus DSM 1736]SDM48435.1 transcriptional attenuator, LytR family [Dendrosporobacter quercicolus]
MSRLEKRLSEQKQIQIKRILAVLAALSIFVMATGASYYWFSTGLFERPEDPPTELMTAQNKMNIMVLGVDERSDDVGRSDTLFLVTVDTNTKEVAMLSIPRDTRVRTPGHGYDKINHAYANGGHKLTQQAVEGLLGISIDRYIMIDFHSFNKIIDAVGGVDIEVEKRMYYEDPYDGDGGLVIDLQPGLQHLDGEAAIQYVRYRDEDGDIGRVQRQQKFIKALMKEVASPSVITRIPAIIQQVSSAIKTDMTTTEMLNLARILNDAYKNGLKTDMVPGKPAYISDISYWLPDIVALRQHLAQTLGLEMGAQYAATARQEARDYETSIPKEMKVAETPKEVKPDTETTAKDDKDNKADEKDEEDQPKSESKQKAKQKQKAKSTSPAKVKVEVLNASGSESAGKEIAAVLKKQGFEVVGVANLTVAYRNTVVVSNTTNSNVVNKLTNMPFHYSLQVTKDESKDVQATILVGTDYIANKE